MKLSFTKMQGLGNDFIVIDAVNQSVQLSSKQIKQLSDRHFGVGCDQLLLIEPSGSYDFYFRIYNANGEEVEQCGNGARCVAKFIYDRGLSRNKSCRLEVKHTCLETHISDDGMVQVNMGAPIFTPSRIPFKTERENLTYRFELNDEPRDFSVLSMGNPHAVTIVDDVKTTDVDKIGRAVENLDVFPQKVNVGFMQVQNNDCIKLRVFERHVGETKACGTGACAAVVAGILQEKLSNKVTTSLQGGTLLIEWDGHEGDVFMTGPAEYVFDGEINVGG